MSKDNRNVQLYAPSSLPEIAKGDNLAEITIAATNLGQIPLKKGDIIVFAQKIVSKAEGRTIRLSNTLPSEKALKLAQETHKDPRVVHHILNESTEIIRQRPGLIIARHRSGCVMANAGIDLSNTGKDDLAILLPKNPDRSAKKIAMELFKLCGKKFGVIINDSVGRAWRNGTVGSAIGSYGIAAIQDKRNMPDRDGRKLINSQIAIADEIAAAASLLMGQGDESFPLVILRGFSWGKGNGTAKDLIRPIKEDLFR